MRPEGKLWITLRFAEFYLRLDDGRLTRGRNAMMYRWSVNDWHLLRNCYLLDIEEFCWSWGFQRFIEQYGTVEQKRSCGRCYLNS